MVAHRGRDLRSIAAGGDNAWPAAKAALAMSTPKPRPAPVMSHTFRSVMTCSSFGVRATKRPQYNSANLTSHYLDPDNSYARSFV